MAIHRVTILVDDNQLKALKKGAKSLYLTIGGYAGLVLFCDVMPKPFVCQTSNQNMSKDKDKGTRRG